MSEWVDIPGHPGYQVSDMGRVRKLGYTRCDGRKYKTKELRTWTGRKGYQMVSLPRGKNGAFLLTRVHLLVMLAYVGEKPPGMETRHLDGDPANNRLSNLKYGTPKQNQADRNDHGTSNKGERNPMRKISKEDAEVIRNSDLSNHLLARKYGVCYSNITSIKRGDSW